MLTVIGSVSAALNIAAACSMPARKLAGAAIAAASNSRLMVKPLDPVTATVDPGPPGPLAATAAWASCASAEASTGSGVGGAEFPGLPSVPGFEPVREKSEKSKLSSDGFFIA